MILQQLIQQSAQSIINNHTSVTIFWHVSTTARSSSRMYTQRHRNKAISSKSCVCRFIKQYCSFNITKMFKIYINSQYCICHCQRTSMSIFVICTINEYNPSTHNFHVAVYSWYIKVDLKGNRTCQACVKDGRKMRTVLRWESHRRVRTCKT